jgi:hypothetical protein
MRANEIVNRQIEHMETKEKLPVKHSSAGEAKTRYIAGACSNKISSRLRNSVPTTPPNRLIQVFISSMSESILFLQKWKVFCP